MNLTSYKTLSKKHNVSIEFIRNTLCRPEFNKFRHKLFARTFYDTPEFRVKLKAYFLRKRDNNLSRVRNRIIIT